MCCVGMWNHGVWAVEKLVVSGVFVQIVELECLVCVCVCVCVCVRVCELWSV